MENATRATGKLLEREAGCETTGHFKHELRCAGEIYWCRRRRLQCLETHTGCKRKVLVPNAWVGRVSGANDGAPGTTSFKEPISDNYKAVNDL